MPDLHVPVRPDLDQLRHQAKDLLAALRSGDPDAVALFERNHPSPCDPAAAKLAHAQLALARAYGVSSWPRLVTACRMIDAIWRDDADAVRMLVRRQPHLLHDDARGVQGNWGPPMSYAANLGRDAIVAMLRQLGAEDLDFAFDRAVLQGRTSTAHRLLAMGARPSAGIAMGPAETQNPDGLAFLIELGIDLADETGDRLAPVALVLETYSRNPAGKHACLEIFARQGIDLPDTPPMAVHRGRVDLIESHLRRDPDLLARTFTHDEIYPRSLGCHADESLALHGTPLAGATLMHMCIDYDEMDIAEWLLEQGADPDVRAEIDRDGFGGHSPLFASVVVQSPRLRRSGEAARLLLDRGADPNLRASLRKRLRFVEDEALHEYRDVTPLGWGARFHDRSFVSGAAVHEIHGRGGRK